MWKWCIGRVLEAIPSRVCCSIPSIGRKAKLIPWCSTYFGTTPWEDPQLYIDKSPFFRLTDVTTPTLIHTGTQDTNVPPHQSWSLFRAMQYIDQAPVRFLTYPGEPHGLRKIAHQRRKAAEDVAWLDRYLFETYEAENEAIKKGSPLEALLKRSKASRVGNAYGEDHKGVLVPETVAFEGLNVGRFEVTRAQYAAFDKDYKVRSGEENLPMTGVAFDRAQAYVAWLAKATGRAFRLPSREEARKMAKKAGHDGNTLDRWAGYTPNPDDLRRLTTVLRGLEEGRLLRTVGEFPGCGDDPVFDLDGNVAEWAVTEKSDGIAMGPSAMRPTDPRSPRLTSTAYVGWRVTVDD